MESGKVIGVTKAGKHWSVEVKFEEEQRRILGTFLTKEEKLNYKKVTTNSNLQ